MVAASVCFALASFFVRQAANDVHPFEITFFRNAFSLMFMLPWLIRVGRRSMFTKRPGLHAFRAVMAVCAMFTWFTALAMMPLAEATALSFTWPLFATVGAALVLGETVRRRRWTAIGIGFLGTLIILRPGEEAVSTGAALVLVSSAFMAISALTVKALSRVDSPPTIVLLMAILTTPIAAIPTVFVWTTPAPETWAWLVALGLAATVGQLTLAKAFVAADLTAVMPFDFSKLIFTAIIAYLAFGEVPDAWTWIGSVVIFGAAFYTAHREAQLARGGAVEERP